MILKKPYAFLIKHFRFLHFVLATLMIYLAFRTNIILKFYNAYIINQSDTIIDAIGTYNQVMFILPFVFLAFLIIVLAVLLRKQKPVVFYVVNIVIALASLIIYNFSYSNTLELEKRIMELRELNFVRDIVQLLFYFQIGSALIFLVRATGIDVKKFGFNEELKSLEVAESDAEEVEVSFSVNTEGFQRFFRKTKRFIKYYYIEKKLNFFVILFIVAGMFGTALFLMFKNDNRLFNMNEVFYTDKYSINVVNAYILQNNYKGFQMVDDNFVVIETEISNLSKSETLITTEFQLVYKDKVYYHEKNLTGSPFLDIGQLYKNARIGKEKTRILLVYEVPENINIGDLYFRYVRNYDTKWGKIDPVYDRVNLNYQHLDNNYKTTDVDLKEAVIIENTNLKDIQFTINAFEINDKFTLNYRFCPTTSNCYSSLEYVKPNLNKRYDKVLLSINGVVENAENSLNNYNLYTFLEKFGKIIYSKDGKTIYNNISSSVSPSKVNIKDNYYIEIKKDIMESESLSLQIQIRNNIYNYKLK